jgi:hypothetical protein
MAENDDLSKRVLDLEKELKSLASENKSLKEQLSNDKVSETYQKGDLYLKSQSEAMANVGSMAKNLGAAFSQGLLGAVEGINLLETQGVQIQNSLGVSRQRMEEFKTLIADVGPVLASMGVSEDQFASTIISVTEKLGGAATLSAKAITDMQAAAQVTGQDVGTLAANFREVGISMYDVGEEMKDVANYAKNVGVPVKAVAEGVVTNLSKINLYNFDGGVQGLTKMATQASRLGVDMTKVFTIADELFSPEKAIDYAASLQRLGVTANGLLDPLRAMDMAQNDPAALQEEIVNLTKDFVRFSEENNKFEIMPGAQRRMREVAGALNIDAAEFAKMGIQAAEFDRKLSQIKLPSFADDKETKELIASMSQIKDGVATVTIKNIQTGEVELKQPDQLTPEDIEKLKTSSEESSKSIEQLAVDQLDQLKFLNSQIDSVRLAGQLGTASLGPVQRLAEMAAQATRGGTRAITTEYTSAKTRETFTPATRAVEDAIISAVRDNKMGLEQAMTDFQSGLSVIKDNTVKMAEGIVTKFDAAMKNSTKGYDPVIQRLESKNDINVNMSIDVKGGQNVKVSNAELSEQILNLMKTDTVIQQTIKNAAGSSQLSMNPNKP